MKTVKIGKQEWMAENLNASTFRNGDPIPEVKSDEAWTKAGEEGKPAWCYYENDPENGKVYGKLYNWYAVNDSRGISPQGWHIPSDNEWKELEKYLGMRSKEIDDLKFRGKDKGGKLKKPGIILWKAPNVATNESGFSALPGGYRFSFGDYLSMGYSAYFWSPTELNSDYAWCRSLSHDNSEVYRDYNYKLYGYSVRCVR
jgi:uncharacterized protein (TIGR02145 family)